MNDVMICIANIFEGIYIFEADLIELFHYMRMENPGLSHSGFLSALGFFSQKHCRVRANSNVCNYKVKIVFVLSNYIIEILFFAFVNMNALTLNCIIICMQVLIL
jgi:hypothetical protein